MLISKTIAMLITTAISLAPQNAVMRQGEPTNVPVPTEVTVECQDTDRGIDTCDGESRRVNANLTDEDSVYLTDPETGERITEVEVGGEYDLHLWVVNDGEPNKDLADVRVIIGQGDDYSAVCLNLLIRCADATTNERLQSSFASVLYPVDRSTCDAWLRFRPVGKAKLYNNGGLLNGAQVNHKKLFASAEISSGIYVGYDDQDGYLPYGEEYACEIRVRVKLAPVDSWDHFWSEEHNEPGEPDDYHEMNNTNGDTNESNSSYSGTGQW